MSKINLKGVSQILSDKELKNVKGGASNGCFSEASSCNTGSPCNAAGDTGKCEVYTLPGTTTKVCACNGNATSFTKLKKADYSGMGYTSAVY
jgi:natural product precursor